MAIAIPNILVKRLLLNMDIILRENEKIIKEVREHGSVVVVHIIFWMAVVVGVSYTNLPWEFLGGVSLLALLVVIGKLFFWYRTRLTITDQRVVCRVQEGLFTWQVIEILIRDIKELSYARKGIASAVWGYGDLIVRTSADVLHAFERIPHPGALVESINRTR